VRTSVAKRRGFPYGRRACAALAAVFASAGLLVLPFAAAVSPAAASVGRVTSTSPSPAASATTSPASSRRHKGLTAPEGGVLIRGPRMYNPNTNKRYKYRSSVTVSQVSSLVNQTVQVKWSGFTPSSNVPYTATDTNYPVMIAECRGLSPRSISDCFGATNAGVQGTTSAYGPMNTTYAVTAGNGTGSAYVQLLTGEQNSFLGCDVHSPCSLAIVPADGGIPPSPCNNHSADEGGFDEGSITFTQGYSACAWDDRIVVPLHFDPLPTDCPVRNPDFTVIGSPMAARAMSSWQTELCSASDPETIQYDSAQSEPLARQDFQSGADDVALTTLPASGQSKHPYAYAPVAISAESVAFWLDSQVNYQPITHLKLDPRLVLKLLTESYSFDNEACVNGGSVTGSNCNADVDDDPETILTDPEFEQLNPKAAKQTGQTLAAEVGGAVVPTVLSGESDMTWTLTEWIAANKDALEFSQGDFDPWGDHININYLRMQLPTNSLLAADPDLLYAHLYSPTYPLSQVAEYQALNWTPATEVTKDAQGNYEAVQPETAGQRALFSILDEGDAAELDFPVASLENAAGNYVAPTDATMAAAIDHDMITAKNGITQTVNQNGKVRNAYPLTMVIYAMVPTAGISKSKAAKIAQWLDYVAGAGQDPGYGPGQLPPGYLPLTANMRAQTLKAASEVLAQAGDKPAHSGSPTPSMSSSPAASTSTPAPSASASTATIGLGEVANPATSGIARYALPALLIAAGLLAVAGGFALVTSRGGTAVLGRFRRLRLSIRRKQ
jgi:hypothetical protein